MGFIKLVHEAYNIGRLGIEYRHAADTIWSLKWKLEENYNLVNIKPLLRDVDNQLRNMDFTLFSKSYGPTSIQVSGMEGEVNTEN